MKLLVLTRKYPPQIGGMQKQSFELIRSLKLELKENIDYLYLNKNQLNLIWWIPLNFFKAFIMTKKNNYDIIHICDGLLSPLGLLLKKISSKKVTVTIHGLDVVYNNKLYQLIVPYCIKKLDKIFCVSKNTAKICIDKGIDNKKISVITNGVNPDEFSTDIKNAKEILSKKINCPLYNKKIIITVGRLVKRKGVSWFIEDVFPELKKSEKNIVYIIAGSGKEENDIKNKIKENKNIIFLGKIDDDLLKILYNSADCFVMPNIPVPDNIEGFGIVAIEASSKGVPVVASNIDGINEAVINNKNGFLVESRNIDMFKKRIIEAINMDKKRRNEIKIFTEKKFGWNIISKKYIDEFLELLKKSKHSS